MPDGMSKIHLFGNALKSEIMVCVTAEYIKQNP